MNPWDFALCARAHTLLPLLLFKKLETTVPTPFEEGTRFVDKPIEGRTHKSTTKFAYTRTLTPFAIKDWIHAAIRIPT